MRAAPYKVPLTAMLTPAPMSLAAFDRLWGMLPAVAEHGVTLAPAAGAAAGAGAAGATEEGMWETVVVAADGGDADAALAAALAALGGGISSPGGAAAAGSRSPGTGASPLWHAGGYSLGAGGGACECFSAVTWQGDYLLCTVFAAGEAGGYGTDAQWGAGRAGTTGRGMRLEYRARYAAVLAPIVNDPRGWLTALAGNVLRLVPADILRAGDADLFGGGDERVSDAALAAGPGSGGGGGIMKKLQDAVLEEWRAIAV